ncbi:MAG: DNA-3-methyladenine glycosylase I [Deinococcales bacterium]|jgi:DNA-3-methyladenine glycosylase I
MSLTRCAWAGDDPRMCHYHDEEWGVPVHDDRRWFEMLVLESFQAGLSWRTILHKRDAFREAFADFEIARVAGFTEADEARLLGDAGIVRNRAKIRAASLNAQAFLRVQEAFGSFDAYAWRSVPGAPLQGNRASAAEVPAVTDAAVALARDLKARGFRFVGPTVVYALMQATGLVNDHTVDCFRYAQLTG